MKVDPRGVLCLDKPAGMTSFAAVRAARLALGIRKAGHAGTLDPGATGVLPICVGDATKLTQFLVDHDKCYRARVILGSETDTQDASGRVVATGDPSGVTRARVSAVLPQFIGRISQQVPAYSAVRVDGKRLHERVRRGEVVVPPVREVEVHALELGECDDTGFDLEVHCGRGTYIRTLATDIGRLLGCRAHLGALRRTRVGRFRIEDAVALDDLSPENLRLATPREALAGMPEIVLDAAAAERLGASGVVGPDYAAGLPEGLCAVIDPDGQLCAVVRYDGKICKTARVFRTPACIPSRMEERKADAVC